MERPFDVKLTRSLATSGRKSGIDIAVGPTR
jgi:hypothetical protein